MQSIINKLKILYTKDSYYKKYGKDAIISLGIIYIFLAIAFYFHMMNKFPAIRANWPNNRCNPIYMPFAGVIMKDPKKTNMTQIEDNFAYCTQNILISIINIFIEPILFAVNVIIQSVRGTLGVYSNLRELFDALRYAVAHMTNDVNKKILFSNAPILRQIEAMKSSIHKAAGVFTAGLYELFGFYYTLKSFAGSIIQIIYQLILIPLAISFFAALNIPIIGVIIAWPIFLTYVIIQIPTVIIQVVFVNILKIQKIHIESI